MINENYTTEASTEEIHYRQAVVGNNNNQVKRMQEWLCFAGFVTAIDGIWGPATTRTLNNYCRSKNLPYEGILTTDIWRSLVYPLVWSLGNQTDNQVNSLGKAVLDTAQAYINARELGGNNRGPWVRLFMQKLEGSQWPWCAGFVSHVIAQASFHTEIPKPFKYTYSSSKIIQYARETGRLVLKRNLEKDRTYVFCLKGGSTGYFHTGFAYDIDLEEEVFTTIEGNTNVGGSAEGDSVHVRTRNIHTADFVSLD